MVNYSIKKSAQNKCLHITLFDYEKSRCANYSVKHSGHSQKRASQRNIDQDTLCHILDFGTCLEKQGNLYYVVRDKDLPPSFCPDKSRKLNNMVVIIDKEENEILTCYKSKNAIRHVRRKSKVRR